MHIRLFIIVCLTALLVRAFPANAEGETADPDPYAPLDSWMRAEALNERCNILNYFEVRTIDKSINETGQDTPEGKASLYAVGQPGFEDKLAEYKTMLSAHRKQAQADVTDRPCTPADADIMAARSAYVPFYLRAMLAAQTAPELNSGRAGQKTAAMQLGQFAGSMFGDNYQSVASQMIAQNTSEGVTPSGAWKSIRTSVFDTLWQIRLDEKKYAYQPIPGEPGYYRAKLANVDGAFFPARLGHRFHPDIRDASGAKIRINQAEGVMNSGRIVILVSKDAANWGPNTLEAELLVQDAPDSMAWNKNDWRAGTIRFRAEKLDDPSCPADFCFVFPAEASDAIRVRRADKGASYSYELFIGPPNLFPLKDEESTYQRDRYYPPTLPESQGE
ncbi:hypothetical protein [Hyphomonas sp.]|uniref:hypothetical protein n=1 Tax=Hyphomonas sp. TaxID=87 RepID=UPI0035281567